MSGQNFEGDLLLIDTPDGGDIAIENGLIFDDPAFNTAVYLSLFGGNKEDSGKVKNCKTWWGNTLGGIAENEKLVSRFQSIIAGLPMTTKNIVEAETAASLDLKWIIDEGIGEKITVSGNASGHNTFTLRVAVQLDGENRYKNDFSLLWKAGVHGGI